MLMGNAIIHLAEVLVLRYARYPTVSFLDLKKKGKYFIDGNSGVVATICLL